MKLTADSSQAPNSNLSNFKPQKLGRKYQVGNPIVLILLGRADLFQLTEAGALLCHWDIKKVEVVLYREKLQGEG